MNRSDSIKELASALAKAQASIEGAVKDRMNPAFRSKYADLAACWDAAREPLTTNGLSVMQFPRLSESGVEIETIIMHSSGEYMSDTLTVPVSKRDAHGVGSAITYGRRFAFSAVVGICPEDDDGNKAKDSKDAKGRTDDDHEERKPEAKASPWTPEMLNAAAEAASQGSKAYGVWWRKNSEEVRARLLPTPAHKTNKETAERADQIAAELAQREGAEV